MKQHVLIFLIGLSIFQTSCGIKSNAPVCEPILVDIDKTEILQINSLEHMKIQLETNQETLMPDIWSLSFLKDTIVVLAGKKLMTFDNNGKYIATIGLYGRAANEYTEIASVFTKDSMIYVCDNNVKRILTYYGNNTPIGGRNYGELANGLNFQRLYPLGADKYIGTNVWNGTPGVITPMLGLYDADFKQTKVSKDMNRTSGFAYTCPFSHYNDEQVVFCSFANDTLFHVDKALQIERKYAVDFGKYSLPKKLSAAGPGEIIGYVTSHKGQCASMINYVLEDQERLVFRFWHNDTEHYCYYDKINKKSRTFTLSCEGMKNLSGLYCNNDYLVTVWQSSLDSYNAENPMLIFFKLR